MLTDVFPLAHKNTHFLPFLLFSKQCLLCVCITVQMGGREGGLFASLSHRLQDCLSYCRQHWTHSVYAGLCRSHTYTQPLLFSSIDKSYPFCFRLQGLQSLSLADSRLRSRGTVLVNTLGSNACLRKVDLSGNGLEDTGARMLSKALQINTTLRCGWVRKLRPFKNYDLPKETHCPESFFFFTIILL